MFVATAIDGLVTAGSTYLLRLVVPIAVTVGGTLYFVVFFARLVRGIDGNCAWRRREVDAAWQPELLAELIHVCNISPHMRGSELQCPVHALLSVGNVNIVGACMLSRPVATSDMDNCLD